MVSLRMVRYSLAPLLLLVWCSWAAYAAETDQYLAWGVELEDSTDALNRFLNAQVEEFLKRANSRAKPSRTGEELTQDFYLYMFQGLHYSRVRGWLRHSDEVDRFPDNSVSYFRYKRMSVYRDLSFPYVILPMARTVRLNNVYLGIDKIAHFFGFGRRYYSRYLRYRADGLSEDEAVEKVVRCGIHLEKNFVGQLVDGIFSYADLEADFQGFRMAKDLCGGENPYIVHEGNQWVLARRIDIREYITPDFDESYNNSSYWGTRRRNVLAILKNEYCSKAALPEVQERFARYRRAVPSFSSRTIAKYFEEKSIRAQKEQSVDALRLALE